MRNEEFDIVRDLIAGRGGSWHSSPPAARVLEPAPFREIDGHELARQYVAHRKFLESERLARESSAENAFPDRVRLGIPGGGRGADTAAGLAAYEAAPPGGWLSSLARYIGWR
jgi:hypothetical protein